MRGGVKSVSDLESGNIDEGSRRGHRFDAEAETMARDR